MQINNEKLTALDDFHLDYLIHYTDSDVMPRKLHAFYRSNINRTKYKINSKQPIKGEGAETFTYPENIIILLRHVFAQKKDNSEIIRIFDELLKKSMKIDTGMEADEEALDKACRKLYEIDTSESKGLRVLIQSLYTIYDLDIPDYALINDDEQIPDANHIWQELKQNEDTEESTESKKSGKAEDNAENAETENDSKEKISDAAASADSAEIAKLREENRKLEEKIKTLEDKRKKQEEKYKKEIAAKGNTIQKEQEKYKKLLASVRKKNSDEVKDYDVSRIVDLEALSDSVNKETEHFAEYFDNGDYASAKKSLAVLYVLVSATEDSKDE